MIWRSTSYTKSNASQVLRQGILAIITGSSPTQSPEMREGHLTYADAPACLPGLTNRPTEYPRYVPREP